MLLESDSEAESERGLSSTPSSGWRGGRPVHITVSAEERLAKGAARFAALSKEVAEATTTDEMRQELEWASQVRRCHCFEIPPGRLNNFLHV